MSFPLGTTLPKPFLFTGYILAENLGWVDAGKLSISPPGERDVNNAREEIKAMLRQPAATLDKPFLFTAYTLAKSLGWLRSHVSSFPVTGALRIDNENG